MNNKQVYLSENFTLYLNQEVNEIRFIDVNESPDLTTPTFSVEVKPIHIKLLEEFLGTSDITDKYANDQDIMYFWKIINNLKKRKILYIK